MERSRSRLKAKAVVKKWHSSRYVCEQESDAAAASTTSQIQMQIHRAESALRLHAKQAARVPLASVRSQL